MQYLRTSIKFGEKQNKIFLKVERKQHNFFLFFFQCNSMQKKIPLILIRLYISTCCWRTLTKKSLEVRLLLERCHVFLSSVIRNLTWFFIGIRKTLQWYQGSSSTCLDTSSCGTELPTASLIHFSLIYPPLVSPSNFPGRHKNRACLWRREERKPWMHLYNPYSSSLGHSLVPAAAPHFSWPMCQCTCRNLSDCLLIFHNFQF